MEKKQKKLIQKKSRNKQRLINDVRQNFDKKFKSLYSFYINANKHLLLYKFWGF